MPRITDYPAKASPTASDLLVIVDVEDSTQSAQGSVKQTTIGEVIALAPGGSNAVSSVFGRTGAVVAQSGDYTAAQVGADAAGAAAAAQAASLPKAGGTMTGWVAPAAVALTYATTVAVNAALGNAFNLTLTASTATMGAPSNPVDGQTIRFRITQGSGGSFTLAWNAIYDFGAGSAPTLSTTAGKVDVVAFEYIASISKWIFLGSALGN